MASEQTGAEARPRRILVVANETVAGQRLIEEVERCAAGKAAEVLVVAPALCGRLRFLVSDVDGGLAQAEERVQASVRALRARGIEARGEVGDPDPLLAMEDAMALFHADEIVVSTHPPGRSNWLEKKVPGRAGARFDVPVTHVVVDLATEGQVVPEGQGSAA
jgi:GABA permease